MSLETFLKVGITIGLTAVWFWSVRWLWTTQIDTTASVSRLVKKSFEAPDWVATRDPRKLYQDGTAVGDVTGEVKQDGDTIWFAQLANTTPLRQDAPIEFQRFRLRIVRVDTIIGMKSSVTNQGSQVLTAVMEGVTCAIVKP